jgi:hypothetical protein
MSGVGGRRMRRIEIEDRISFVVDRIHMGLSKMEIQRQLGVRFKLSSTQSRIWTNKGYDSIVCIDKDQRPRVRAAMIEIVHSQIIGLQQDLARVSTEVQSCELARESRSRIQAQLIDADDRERERLKRELASVRQLKPRYYLDSINQRSRLRISIVKCVTEIGRLEGLYVEELPIIRALSILGSSELIPAGVAGSLIDILFPLNPIAIDKSNRSANCCRPPVGCELMILARTRGNHSKKSLGCIIISHAQYAVWTVIVADKRLPHLNHYHFLPIEDE